MAILAFQNSSSSAKGFSPFSATLSIFYFLTGAILMAIKWNFIVILIGWWCWAFLWPLCIYVLHISFKPFIILMCGQGYTCGSEDTVLELVLAFHHVGLRVRVYLSGCQAGRRVSLLTKPSYQPHIYFIDINILCIMLGFIKIISTLSILWPHSLPIAFTFSPLPLPPPFLSFCLPMLSCHTCN